MVRCTSDSSFTTTKELVWTVVPSEPHTQDNASFAERSPKPGNPELETRCRVAVEQDLTQRRTRSSNMRHSPRHIRQRQATPAEVPPSDEEAVWAVANRAPARAGGAQGRRRQPRGDARIAEDEQNRDVTAIVHWGDRDEGGRYWRVQVPEREMVIPDNLEERVARLGNGTVEYVPASLLTRFAVGWAECLEGGWQAATCGPDWAEAGRGSS